MSRQQNACAQVHSMCSKRPVPSNVNFSMREKAHEMLSACLTKNAANLLVINHVRNAVRGYLPSNFPKGSALLAICAGSLDMRLQKIGL